MIREKKWNLLLILQLWYSSMYKKPISLNHTHHSLMNAMKRCYIMVTRESCKPLIHIPQTHKSTNVLLSNTNFALLYPGRTWKGHLWTVLPPICQGWRLDKCWTSGKHFLSEKAAYTLSPSATSGLLWAAAGCGWWQSNRRRLCRCWRAAEPTGKPTSAGQLTDGRI